MSASPPPLITQAVRLTTPTPMKQGIYFSKIWFDDDLVEFRIGVSDGTSYFVNQVYVGHSALADAVSSLDTFKGQVHGGLLDVRFGGFGCEYASGAFQARFHFANPNRLFITCDQESDFEEFANKTVANRATIHLMSEPVLLDRFIVDLKSLVSGEREEASLEAI
jgi:hypothetical protein